MSDQQHHSPLDKTIPNPGWFGISAFVIILVAAFVRIFRLDTYLLNIREAEWAYDAFSMYQGRPLPIGQELPESGPFMLVWNAISFFLFGVTDASARVGSVVLGLGLIGALFLLRPVFSKLQLLSVAGIIAISPTMVFASRTIEPGIAAAFFVVLALVALLRIGLTSEGNHGWAILLGVALAALYATGPLGVSTLLAILIAILVAALSDLTGRSPNGAIGLAVQRLGRDRSMLLWLFGSLIITLLTLFTRAFSSLSSLAGLGATISDWVEVMTSGVGTVPAMFYFWSLMLYETIAAILAIVMVVLSRSKFMRSETSEREITPLLFVVWFAAALLLHTTASTRDTGSTVLVVLPVLFLAGSGLGKLLESSHGSVKVRPVLAAVATIVLVAYSVNATVGLAFTRGESGSEPLSHDTPSAETRALLNQVTRLSRDLSVGNESPQDPTGHFGLTIQVAPDYEWPFTWYFRDYPLFSVNQPGAFTAETDVAIAANAETMDSVGLTPSSVVWIHKPGDPLTMMRSGDILSTGLNPSNWGDAWNYMIHRESDRHENPRNITVGYSVRVMNKLTTETGPFNLFDDSSPGQGGGLGQLDTPAGIATSDDGTIYVLNAGNQRIDRFNADGEYLGIWSGQVEEPLQLSWNGFQGGTGLSVGPDGLIYIADTWNHAVVVVNPNGTVVRVLGDRGNQTDITDAGDSMNEQGLFFGPRDIAISDDHIYVTDTGNERVQIFGIDGTFINAFGGYGEEDGRFIEPTGIAIAPDGTVWVADSGNGRLQVFDAEGNWLESHAIQEWETQSGVDRMNMLVFDENGVLYFTTPNRGVWAWYDDAVVNVGVGQQSDDNLTIMEFGDLRPGGIAIESNGQLLVTITSTGDVIQIDPVPLSTFGAESGTPEATPAATPGN